uniref:Transmembrane protein n=1 Tax=Panagrellus redivivus TaxID=6233 RepID=A0A7E4W155_PANRE
MADIEKGAVYTVETPSPESVLPSKPSESQKSDHIEELLENDGVCGVSYGTLLCLVALGGLFMDSLCCYLALNHIAAYGFAFSVICSLVCFCTTISCIQEEKTNTLRRTAIWPVIKFLVTAVLYFCAIVFVVESVSLPDDSDSFTLTFEHEILLAVLPISLVLTLIHWQLTKKASELMYAKDKFYMIENEEDSNTSMRASLRLYLAADKLKNYEKF